MTSYNDGPDSMMAGDNFDELPEYPTAFGITFTPEVIGICLGVTGLLAAGYVIMTFFLPAWQTYQTSVGDKKTRLDQVNAQEFTALVRQVDTLKSEISKAESDQKQLYSLFANENTVNTLLIDLNKLFQEKGAKMVSFQPEVWEPQLIEDGSLGENVNKKLKRQIININMEGTFFQTQGILRDIEKLQPLLLLKNFNTNVKEKPPLVLDNNEFKPKGEPILTTNFTLELIVPLSEAEIAEMKKAEEEAAAAAAKQGGENKPPEAEKK